MGESALSWTWPSGDSKNGYLGLATIGAVTGLISGVAESLGMPPINHSP